MEKKEIIEKLLKDNIQGLTIQDLSDKSKFTRNTVNIILAKLEGEGLVTIREVGNAKLYYWRKK